MPAYNFKDRFADMVAILDKRQTIRPKRKRATKPGDILFLYEGMRTKHCRRLAIQTCKSVEDILLHPEYGVLMGGHWLNHGEAEELALNDGFDSLADLMEWFIEQYPKLPDVDLELIKW